MQSAERAPMPPQSVKHRTNRFCQQFLVRVATTLKPSKVALSWRIRCAMCRVLPALVLGQFRGAVDPHAEDTIPSFFHHFRRWLHGSHTASGSLDQSPRESASFAASRRQRCSQRPQSEAVAQTISRSALKLCRQSPSERMTTGGPPG